jgi:hypothetical protein
MRMTLTVLKSLRRTNLPLVLSVTLLLVFLGGCSKPPESGAYAKKSVPESVTVDKNVSALPWIENSLDLGFAEARKSGKPLMVVFRCPP